MDFINQLLNLLFSPFGLAGITIAVFALMRAKRSPRVAWLLFSLCAFAASLGKFRDEFVDEPPALVFPLQQLRDNGRPLAIVLLILVLILGMQSQNGWRHRFLPQAIKYLVTVQAIIFLKVAAFGDAGFALLSITTFGMVIQTLRLGPSRWIQDDKGFRLGVWSIAMVGLIFVTVNAYQAMFDLDAITFVQGRFLGTTGNPLHATVLLSAVIPCFMFFIEDSKKWLWGKVFWIASLTSILYALFLTGSRTGLFMAVTSILFFYRNQGGKLIRFILIAGIIVLVILPTFAPDVLGSIDTNLIDRYLSGSNTRSGVWEAQWRGFSSNLLFGVPLRGGRLGFGENSWLAVGVAAGLLGFIPLALFGIECLKMIVNLSRIGYQQPTYFLQTSTVISGLGSLLVGSLSEAFLLGNFTFSLIAVLMYLLLGEYLLEFWDIQRQYSMSQFDKMEEKVYFLQH